MRKETLYEKKVVIYRKKGQNSSENNLIIKWGCCKNHVFCSSSVFMDIHVVFKLYWLDSSCLTLRFLFLFLFLFVSQVAGNFHFAPGKSFQQSHVHGKTCCVSSLLTHTQDTQMFLNTLQSFRFRDVWIENFAPSPRIKNAEVRDSPGQSRCLWVRLKS